LRNQRKGHEGEQAALRLLENAGLQLLERNYRCRLGEIDLIMMHCRAHKKTLVFVEVRYRHSTFFGGAAASVNAAKQKKIIRAAQYFLKTHAQYQPLPARFDVVAIGGESNAPNLNWIQQAFNR
jgi:putative endonuclease